MSNDPDEIRRDIEYTRAELSDNVNALADSANPKNVAQRQVDKVKDGAQNLKEKVFGADDDPYDRGRVGEGIDSAKAQGHDVLDTAGAKVDDAKAAVAQAPRQLKSSTRGNPLAAGLIAFGLGALVGGLMPVSEAEKRASERVKDQVAPVAEQAKHVAQEAADNLRGPAQDAVQQVKDVAAGAAENVKQEAAAAKDDVTTQAQVAKDNVQDARNT